MESYLQAAQRLHRYLIGSHWDGRALNGPDPGIRFNYRIGRFAKGYLPFLPWRDSLYYLQGQGYWVLGSWLLRSLSSTEAAGECAVQASDEMLDRQRDDGAWEYPNPEWRGRVATAEGCWGAIGLVESYRQTGDGRYLEGALRWHRYLTDVIGYQQMGEELAVNYFADRKGARVPNNSAFLLRFLADLADVTRDPAYLSPSAGLLAFLRQARKPTGEMPYSVPGVEGGAPKGHFQCYQYNAFQCLDLMRYHQLTGDQAAMPLIEGMLRFLRGGQAPDGHLAYQCGNPRGAVTYHAAVLGACFSTAGAMGIAGFAEAAEAAYSYVLGLQRPDGGFPHSRGDYGVLSDRRSYPRYLAMILYHLLAGSGLGNEESWGKEGARSAAR